MANYNPKFDTTEHNAIILTGGVLKVINNELTLNGFGITGSSNGISSSGLPSIDLDTAGTFLSNDGASSYWTTVNQLPPSTGSAEKNILQVVNTVPTWVSLKTINNQNIIGTGDLSISGVVAEGWDI